MHFVVGVSVQRIYLLYAGGHVEAGHCLIYWRVSAGFAAFLCAVSVPSSPSGCITRAAKTTSARHTPFSWQRMDSMLHLTGAPQ